MATIADYKLASAAAGFSLGFSTLCVWNAIQQTTSIRSPLRSVYIYMVWGEIVANLIIAVLAWLFLDGTLKPSVPLFVAILGLWVFEVQLLMQIIINRIAVVVDDRKLVHRLKWGTAFIITIINILVFIIWIPAHLDPSPIPIFITINKYWDRTSKVLILLVDAGLNYFFLRTVNLRIVRYHGLTKYAPLVRFNARLMVLSILMDLMLIGLMSLRNQVVYIQFHPVAYMVKLNIEMSMATLITKIARSSIDARNNEFMIQSSSHHNHATLSSKGGAMGLKSGVNAGKVKGKTNSVDMGGIKMVKEINVRVENVDKGAETDVERGTGDVALWRESSSESERRRGTGQAFDARGNNVGRAGKVLSEDELPLAPPPPMKVVSAVQRKAEGW